MDESISGEHALACGAVDAGVSLVTGYPGGPVTGIVNAIVDLTTDNSVRVAWNINEKAAVEMAFGGSLGGMRSLLCVKGVGLNIALDPLMTINLSGCHAGMVILVGDDPGGWGSQNEQDSRHLAMAAEVPLLEPATVYDAWAMMRHAFPLSETTGLPIVLRVTRALTSAQETVDIQDLSDSRPTVDSLPSLFFEHEYMRWVVLPANVVARHLLLAQRLDDVQMRFECSIFNAVEGQGTEGVIAVGFAYRKLLDLFGEGVPYSLRILRLGTLYPLPMRLIRRFLETVDRALVLEETTAFVEQAVRATAHGAAMMAPICGRGTDHVPRAGELFGRDIAAALDKFLPHLDLPIDGQSERTMPSQRPLCDGCPYRLVFDALLDVIAELGRREDVIITGDPGCMVRAQMPPYKLLDVKISLGSAIAVAAGLALSQARADTGKRVVSICGDSGFLHSGVNSLVDVARTNVKMLVLVLDNGTTALSGGQPHPASAMDARRRPQLPVDLTALVRKGGADMVQVVDLDRGENIRGAIRTGIVFDGLAVIIARGRCVEWL